MLRNWLFATVVATGVAAAPSTAEAGSKTMQKEAAVFAAGCFWCVEEAFYNQKGVLSTKSGFIGGSVENPSYKQVTAGGTGHREAVRVIYDPRKTSYKKLLKVFWQNVDPIDSAGQFCDKGESYKGAIYYMNDAQKKAALASKSTIDKLGVLPGSNVIDVIKAGQFYAAEDNHQQYFLRNPVRYKYYKWNCGRKQRLDAVWSKMTPNLWDKVSD